MSLFSLGAENIFSYEMSFDIMLSREPEISHVPGERSDVFVKHLSQGSRADVKQEAFIDSVLTS